jgi:serine O-acetyltransferase
MFIKRIELLNYRKANQLMALRGPGVIMEEKAARDQCEIEIETRRHSREEIPRAVEQLVLTCDDERCFDHTGPDDIPSRETIIDIALRICRILFPGYFTRNRLERFNLPYYFGQKLTDLFELMSEQITVALRHDCIRHNLPCIDCEERGQQITSDFIRKLPGLRVMLATDVRAAYEGDPAAKSFDEVIFCYPGLFAVTIYRAAHELVELAVPYIPRVMSEYAHSMTGIDIHPGAQIGESFFIDHGTGVVIGETTRIGNRVRLYQGVTIGALSLPKDAGQLFRSRKRHPTIEDDVIIYSGATILGGETVIGARSVIGGNVWLVASVPPDTKVFLESPKLIFRANGDPKVWPNMYHI